MNHVYFLAKKVEDDRNCYRAYDAVNLIGESHISLKSRLHPISMETPQIRMDGLIDPDKTIFPGAENILYFSDGSDPARIIYLGEHQHRIVWGRLNILVRYWHLRWKFFLDGKELASMVPVRGAEPVTAVTESRWSPCLTMMSRADLPEPLAMIMLHFPLLQTAL